MQLIISVAYKFTERASRYCFVYAITAARQFTLCRPTSPPNHSVTSALSCRPIVLSRTRRIFLQGQAHVIPSLERSSVLPFPQFHSSKHFLFNVKGTSAYTLARGCGAHECSKMFSDAREKCDVTNSLRLPSLCVSQCSFYALFHSFAS